MIKYLKRTWKNKLVALTLVGIGWLSIGICNDATAFVFVTAVFGIPLFFAKRNYVMCF